TEIIPESEMVNRFLSELKKINVEMRDEEIAKRWLTLSKGVKKNPLGEYGRSGASGVKARGIKDFAYLMMRKHGSPMHFREVAKAITNTFDKKCHTATCHNELIKDKRFVLVGRGMYALSEWGYKPGVVRDVIKEILKREGPMTKEDVVDKVLKERYLKKNTILVNLQNPKYFKKNKDKTYSPL
ncbi:MAG: HTH domain-containing protein, partial [bacterium]